MSEMVERVARAISEALPDEGFSYSNSLEAARAVIQAMRELPENPGPRYSAGEYSRRNHAAMIDDCLND